MVFQLFYKSTSAHWLTQQDLDDIVLTSIERNLKINVTGCLVFFNKEFYQILEGKKADVLALYNDIKEDTRHYHITLLNQERTKYRIFLDWNMALHLIGEERNSEYIVEEFRKKILILNSLNYSSDTSIEFWYDVKNIISKQGFNLSA